MANARTALVTGANRGIGLAIARGLSDRGYWVLVAARQEEDAVAAAEEIEGDAMGVGLDLSDPEEAYRRAREIDRQHGPIDVLVNNAGTLQEGDALELSEADLLDSLAVNAVSPFALIRALAPGMKRRGWGRIVNVSSGWGSFAEGLTGPAAYSISKATLNALTVSFARSLGPAVKVNAVSPGWVRTRMGGASADRSPAEGAAGSIWLATLPDDGPTGKFFRDRNEIAW